MRISSLPETETSKIAMRFASRFMTELKLNAEVEQRCEWSCILWSKDNWAERAQKSKIELEQAKEQASKAATHARNLETLFVNSQFLNSVAQVYSKLFNGTEKTCSVKDFPACPFMGQRQDLLNRGSLASVFVTILHKATFYAMLDRHPLDSGLLDEEYGDVYGINFTDFEDLENSLRDGRFEKLYQVVVMRASELAGFPTKNFR